MNRNESFYRNVEAERVRNKLTISQCAESLGITEKTYRNRRDNRSNISPDDLVKIAKLFGVSIDYLCGISTDRKG